MHLKAADVLSGRHIGRPAEKGRKAAYHADIVALRIGPQPAHRHVFQHALPQRTDRAFDR